MSLKAIHIFFISLSVLLAFGFGIWCFWFQDYLPGGLSILAGIGLIVYGIRFLRKLRHINMM